MIALLGARSDFSLGESLLSPEEIAKYAADNGYSAVSLTDTMSLSSMVRFGKACAKYNVQPIHGVRLRICDDALDKTPSKKRETKNREILIKAYALTDAGMERLYQLLSIAYQDDHFYYVPRLSLQEVCDALSQGGLAISSGDTFNAFGHPQGIHLWRTLTRAVGASYAFLELCPVATPLYDRTNEIALREHLETGVSLLMTRPALYSKPEDADTLDILSTITSAMKMTDPWRPIPWVRDFALQPFSTLRGQIAQCHRSINSRFPHDLALWASALANDRALIEMCSYRWSKRDISLPQMAQDESATLKALAVQGWQVRLTKPQLGYQPTDLKPYAERLVYELNTLQRLGFERYFLLVHDLVKWAKDNGVRVGPGRGSVGGSLVAYLLGITDVDPLRFKLIFERFINPERLDLPDADLDFATSGRQRVVDYLVARYGADCVAGITNYSTLASASALRDTARVHDLPLREYDCTKLVPKVHGKSHELNQAADEVPEIEAFKLKYPNLWNHAVLLQGKMRAYGTHAAGVCVAGEPLMKRAPVITRSGFPTIAYDKREVEDQGLIKIDVLGLSTLDILRIACELIEKRYGRKVDLLDVPLDDIETLDAFGRGETNAVFQFGSAGIKQLLRDLALNKRLTFNDISAATALFRPGPLDSGETDEYVRVSRGVAGSHLWHPAVDAILKETNGVAIYQETIMRIATDVSGMSLAQADKLRSAVSKKNAAKMEEQRERFVGGLIAGWVEVEMEDGSTLRVHRLRKFMVSDNDDLWTMEEIEKYGFDMVGGVRSE